MTALDVEAVLREHKLASQGEDVYRHREYDLCTCGSRHPRHDGGRWPTHRAHVAAVLRVEIESALAGVWSEAYHHGVDDMTGTETLTVVRRNPYRASLAATEGDRQ